MVPRQTLFATILLFAVALPGCGILSETDGEPSSVTVAAQRRGMVIDIPARGELEALSASPIAVPRVPTGALKVKQVVAEGSIVEAGDIVLVFDNTALSVHQATFRSTNRQIDGNRLEATIEADTIDVMRRVAELERDNIEAFEVIDKSIYSRREILEDEVRLDTAEETILFADASLLLRGEYYDIEERILGVEKDQVEGKIGRVESSLGQLVLKAPIGGLIVYKKNWRGSAVGVGDTLWPGNVVMSIVDPESTALKAFVLERDAAGLTVDSEATVTVDARPEHTFRGRVSKVAEISRPIERGSPVKYTEVQIELADVDPKLLKPGMKGEARIVTATLEDVVVVPRSAVRGEADAPFVLVQTADGKERREVKLGPGDLIRVSIEEGLDGTERLILGGNTDDDGPAQIADATPRGRNGG